MIKYRQFFKSLAFLSLTAVLTADLATHSVVAQTVIKSSIGLNGKSVTFSCNDSESSIKAKNGPKVVIGLTTIYIGYQQVSSVNKDPRIIRFDNGFKTWCRSDYETTNDDGTGYGLYWDGGSALYGVFSSTGTQTGNDFRRFATKGWLTSYGNGGGAKVAVLAQIDPANGSVLNASYVSAKMASTGKTNSLIVTNLSWNGTSKTLTLQADSAWTPRRPDRNPMTCTTSPIKYTAVFASDLTKVLSASATNCQ